MDHLLSAESVIAEQGSFWGALNRAAMVHRIQPPSPMDPLPSLSLSLLIHPASPLSSLSLYRARGCLPPLSRTFVSTVCLHVSARPERIWALRGLPGLPGLGRVREGF